MKLKKVCAYAVTLDSLVLLSLRFLVLHCSQIDSGQKRAQIPMSMWRLVCVGFSGSGWCGPFLAIPRREACLASLGAALEIYLNYKCARNIFTVEICRYWVLYEQSSSRIKKMILSHRFWAITRFFQWVSDFVSRKNIFSDYIIFSLLGFGREQKTPASWDSHSRNSPKSTINPNTTIPQTSPPWCCRLPLLRHGIYGSARSDVGNLIKGGWVKALRLGLI